MATTNVTQPIDGHARVDYELLIPTGAVGQLGTTVIQQEARITENVFGYGTAVITLRTQSPDYVDRVIKALQSSGTPLIRFRFGIGVTDRVAWTPWQLHFVKTYRGVFTGSGPNAGHGLLINTEDVLSLVDRASKTSAHRGKISEIVNKLAERNGIKDRVIEDTDTQGLWVQSYTGDFEFVRKRLVRVARSKQGRGNYVFFVRDNVLHFHTLDYQADVKSLIYYNSPGNSLELTDAAQLRIDMGSAGVRLVGHDPYTGQSREIGSNPAEALRFGNWISSLSNVLGAQRNLPFHLSENRGIEAINIAQNTYEAARNESYQMKLVLVKSPIVRAGDILKLVLEPNSGQASSWGGLWYVAAASHKIDKGEIMSAYTLQRGELQALKGVSNALLNQGVNIVEDQQNAPGYDVNLQQTQISQLTHGAGRSVGGGTYLNVQDPNKATG